MTKNSVEEIQFLIHHIVLPPKLPQSDDFNPALERALLDTTVQALEKLQSTLKKSYTQTMQQVSAVQSAMRNLINCRNHDGHIIEAQLAMLIRSIAMGMTSAAIPLEVKAQNAGIIISRHEDDIVFEVFELSPLNEAVIGTTGRLTRSFPTYACRIPAEDVLEQGFVDALSHAIAKMSIQEVAELRPQVWKANMAIGEVRDTMHPGLVTDYLTNVLAALGQPTNTHSITKNTREDVLWRSTSRPWRRSPLWLLVRVTMQLEFARTSAELGCAGNLYKIAMVNLLAELLNRAKWHYSKIGPGMLHCISAKLARRLRKVKHMQPQSLHLLCTASARQILTDTYKLMNARHAGLVENLASETNIEAVGALQPETSLEFELPDLDGFVQRIAGREKVPSSSAFRPSSWYPEFSSDVPPNNFRGVGDQTYFELAEIEKWVEGHLDAWLDEHAHEEDSSERLRCLIQEYSGYANPIYSSQGDPKSMSTMYVTIAELWIACDICTCNLYPLLRDYDPEVDMEPLQSLSLPFRRQLARLHEIECYMQSRRSRADQSRPSLFTKFGHPDSFAVKYFDESPEHQALRDQVEEDAEEERKEKREELALKKKEYEDLMAKSDQLQCEYVKVVCNYSTNFTKEQHSSSCARCALRNKAAEIQITVHEWPLSSNDDAAKATIVELQIPAAFSNWRDATTFLMLNVLGFTRELQRRPGPQYALRRDSGLKEHETIPEGQRIGLLSNSKPHTGSHYKIKSEMTFLGESDVCVENGRRYAYFDFTGHIFTAPLEPTLRVSSACTYRLPYRSSKLQQYLPTNSTDGGVTPNSVIASVHDCPQHMSISEYKAFGTLAIGYNIYYLNILTQLAMPTVDFAKIETQCLILQSIHLAGPASEEGTTERLIHHIMTDETFCETLMEGLEAALGRVRENWETWRALSTFVQLAHRVLTLTNSPAIRAGCIDYLESCRQTVLVWLGSLKQRSRAATNDAQRAELCSRVTEVALLCTSTFDVEDDHLPDVLCSTSAVSALIQSSIIVQENAETTATEHSPFYRAMMQSWRRLMFRAFPVLKSGIVSGELQDGLNEAVTASWATFQPTCSWSKLEGSQRPWIQAKCGTLDVHYNLLTAELLVSGLPLTRLPPKYMKHELYLSLFKQNPIEVMPTNEPGMGFSAKHAHNNYDLNFGMDGTDMLLVAATKSTKFDIVPSRFLNGAVPSAFTQNYLHWYDHSTGEVTFRPRDRPWSAGADLWRLRRVHKSWHLVKGSSCFVNPASGTGHTVANIFAPIERPHHIHISYDASTKIVSIELPRLQIEFYFDSGKHLIHSRQYRGMVIDRNQHIGSLFGLSNKLVLKHLHRVNERLVLVPEGPVTYSTQSNRAAVSIDVGATTKIHVYRIDTTLGRLVDNGSLQSKLVLCYLHALTSHWLPDTLTGKTGTEAALSILRSAAVRSLTALTAQNLELLELIAKLTPKRIYYPMHIRVMQQVQWDERLCFMSQHPAFFLEVQGLIGEARKGRLFYHEEGHVEPKLLDFTQVDLVKRDIIRTSNFRVDGYGAECFTTKFDQVYSTRGQVDLQRGEQSFIAATLIVRSNQALHSRINAQGLQGSLRYTHFQGADVTGNRKPLQTSELKFDVKWLREPSSFLPELWCCLHSSLTSSSHKYNKFDVMMWLSVIAFAVPVDKDLVQAFAAFYRHPELAPVSIPPVDLFQISKGDSPQLRHVKDLVQDTRNFETCPEYSLAKKKGELEGAWRMRRENLFRANRDRAIEVFAGAIHSQWPCSSPVKVNTHNAEVYIDTEKTMSNICPIFKIWDDNKRFFGYIKDTATALQRQNVTPVPIKPLMPISPCSLCSDKTTASRYFGVKDVFALKPPLRSSSTSPLDTGLPWPEAPNRPAFPLAKHATIEHNTEAQTRLSVLCEGLDAQASSLCEKEYVIDLREGCKSLAGRNVELRIGTQKLDPKVVTMLHAYTEKCHKYFIALHSLLVDTVKSGDGDAKVGHSPRMSRVFWLQQLNRDRFDGLTDDWKSVIIAYALAITELQRSRRLVALSDHPQDFAAELSNFGHQNWDPLDFPETLLLEAESGIMVREVQEEIAKQMRSPPDGANSVMQLNMGEGKSSVIVPIVAAALADSKSLVRVIVAKPQSTQMLQMLVSKLGGLLNRRIYHMPFSRALKLDSVSADVLGKIYKDCMAMRGVMLVQPEHLLSFKLMGIECLLSDKLDVARSLLATQEFFDTKSRDIVDESDENFSVKFELIYTMGTQRPVEMSPDRWNIAHSVLDLISKYAPSVKAKMPYSIEVDGQAGGRYPRVRILRSDAGDMLLDRIATHICETGFPGLAVARQPASVQEAVYRYIRHPDLSREDVEAVENGPFWTESTKLSLWLVRGLIGSGVVRFALGSKRWRVNYGTDLNRSPATRLAVPYRSKDCPSPRSEFSHPDVVIILTSLSYYYSGLNDEELFDTFAHLLKSDQRDIEYGGWIRSTTSLPEGFRRLNGVNVKDRFQCTTQVFPLLRYSKGAIDYFLSRIVFPKEMKEFPHKLAASGWDVGAIKSNPTTGFSGTNDSRHVLPLSVNHLDLPEQKHTNAMVFAYLLQDETSVELLPPRAGAEISDAEQLLNTVGRMTPETRVILDVGAQIIELNNFQVAKTWLAMTDAKSAKAVVFFNDKEELMVLDRSGRVESLQVSAFAGRLDECLVYLDEAHTRGTDLKLPRTYRAAVTLGANLTKDRLVQACMRMRKLGKGQSVVFCIPEEIQTKILERVSKAAVREIQASDVLTWAVSETWADLRRSMPLWASQGRCFEQHKDLLNGADTCLQQAKQFLEDEARSIEQRYRPCPQSKICAFSGWDMSNQSIQQIVQRCQDFEAFTFTSATLEEEQERELCPEIEEEREVQRPEPMEPEKHRVHPHLLSLITTARLPANSDALIPAMQALKTTSAAHSFSLSQFPEHVFVTADFMRTVKQPKGSVSYVADSYLRPVQWILSTVTGAGPATPTNSRLVVISPFEANELLPKISTSASATLHLYAPRQNLGYSPLDGLDLYCIGRRFKQNNVQRKRIVQLNLFAGQLYFKSYAEYTTLCEYLGLAYSAAKDGQVVNTDGFVLPPTGAWGLKSSPVKFLREFMKIRREGEGMEKTQMGKVLNGALLEEDDFD